MEEEKKEMVEEEQPVEEQPAEEAAEQPQEPLPEEVLKKNALIAFIAACVGVVFLGTGVLALVGGIIATVFIKKNRGQLPEDKTHNIFAKIAKIAGLILIIVGAVLLGLAILGGIIALTATIIGAIAGAISSALLIL